MKNNQIVIFAIMITLLVFAWVIGMAFENSNAPIGQYFDSKEQAWVADPSFKPGCFAGEVK